MIRFPNTQKRRKITLGTREWADHNVNCIHGCYNDCRYCYARLMAKRFGRATDDSWKMMRIRKDVLRRSFAKEHGRIMFPSTHDIFDFSPFKEACLTVLDKLLRNNNEVLITTKPKLAVVKEITHRFVQYRQHMQFRFTITSIDDDLLKFWEPNATTFNERLASLKYAYYREFKTSISVEPFLDNDPTELVEVVIPFVTGSIWIGKMNYIRRKDLRKDEIQHYVKARENYKIANLKIIFHKLGACSQIRFKDSIRNQLFSS